nr:hypothetical protein [uncultured Dyadobacter sp.]
MEFTDFLSTAILVGAAALLIFKLGRSAYNLFFGDIILTNPKNGKSVRLGRHYRRGLAQELQDMLD